MARFPFTVSPLRAFQCFSAAFVGDPFTAEERTRVDNAGIILKCFGRQDPQLRMSCEMAWKAGPAGQDLEVAW